MRGRRSLVLAAALALAAPLAAQAAGADHVLIIDDNKVGLGQDGRVHRVGKDGKPGAALGNGVHALRDGKFIVVQGGRVVAPDMVIGPTDLPFVERAGKQPGGRAEGILIGLNQPRLLGDGSVRLFDKAGKQQKALGNGVHKTASGKFIIIQNGKVVAPDMLVGIGLLLPAVQKASPQLQTTPQMPAKR